MYFEFSRRVNDFKDLLDVEVQLSLNKYVYQINWHDGTRNGLVVIRVPKKGFARWIRRNEHTLTEMGFVCLPISISSVS